MVLRSSSQSLRPAQRLRKRKQFLNFFGKSQLFRLQECSVYRVKNEQGHFRLGITLKARGSSIERNRLKRAVREAFRRAAGKLGSYDYNVVIPQTKKLTHLYVQELRESLKEFFQDERLAH